MSRSVPLVLVVFGTRPEAIKLAPVIRVFRESSALRLRVVVTAQHRQMLDQVLEVFGIQPDDDLNLMQAGQTLAEFTARALVGLDRVFVEHRPDLVLVQGDTSTVLAASLAAFYRHIPVGHVEAGLRTFNRDAPWPEETNRVVTGQLADLHFAPTEQNRQNLIAEGIASSRIHVTGNTGVDALLLARDLALVRHIEIPGLPVDILDGRRFVLVTGHRRESFGSGFQSICRGIALLADRYPDVDFVYPVHLNPEVRRPVEALLGQGHRANVHLIEPLPYLAFVRLMEACQAILTDSGGIQEEAPSLGKPVFVMRETTERLEAVWAGVSRLVGTNPDRILSEVSKVLDSPDEYAGMAQGRNPFGDGHASEAIRDIVLAFLTNQRR